ncbi:MAG: YncE family protein [Candidatus Limnocylindrales bacterium]
MALRLEGYIDLPEHAGPGGFDHAAVHRAGRRLYVAHTANDALDVIDLDTGSYVESIGGLTGVAGALVDEASGMVFTSNRGEDTVGIFDARDPASLVKVPLGRRPNGLAFDPGRGTLLAANVGDPADPASHTLSVVDTGRAVLTASIPVAGRTRWPVFDAASDRFFVNIADPATIVVVEGADPTAIAATIPIPAAGPHGLDIDEAGLLYCACDAGRLLVLAPPAFEVVADVPLSGSPDVIFLDQGLRHLYVAIGDPGLIEVFEIGRASRLDVVETERGAHTIGLDPDGHRVYAFLPATHRAAVFEASRTTAGG